MLQKSYVVPFTEGFHARPASQFIQLVKEFSGDVQIELKGKSVNGKSLIHILTLGAKQRGQLTVSLIGDEKEAASIFTKLDEFFSG